MPRRIPLPKTYATAGRPPKYPFRELRPGGNSWVPYAWLADAHSAASHWRHRNPELGRHVQFYLEAEERESVPGVRVYKIPV